MAAESNVPQLVDKKGDDIIALVISCETAKATWTDLVNNFEGPSDTKKNRIMDLKQLNPLRVSHRPTPVTRPYSMSYPMMDEEEVSEEMTQVKVLMSLADDELSVERIMAAMNKKKVTRNRQKRTSQSADAPRQTLWTTKEEIALCKGWLAISENSKDGNAKKQSGFWVEVLEYIESKTKQHGHRTYDMESGAEDKYYVQRAMVHYEIDTGVAFKLLHC
ncbi:hypothetical protein Tco_1201757 [Tanacetum coccineum]